MIWRSAISDLFNIISDYIVLNLTVFLNLFIDNLISFMNWTKYKQQHTTIKHNTTYTTQVGTCSETKKYIYSITKLQLYEIEIMNLAFELFF